MDRVSRGLLSGIVGATDAYSEELKKKSKRDFENEKANTLWERQKNLANMNNGFKIQAAENLVEANAKGDARRSNLRKGETEYQLQLAQDAKVAAEREEGFAIANQTVPSFNNLSNEEQEQIVSDIVNQRKAAPAMSSSGPSNKDIIDATNTANKSWMDMSDDEREAYASKKGVNVNLAKGKYVEDALSKLQGKSGFKYNMRPKDILELEMLMYDDVASAKNREDALKLLNTTRDTGAKAKLLSIIDEMYPTTNNTQDPIQRASTGMQVGGDTDYTGMGFIETEMARPTALDGLDMMTDKVKVPRGITAPLKGLLGGREEL